MIVLDEKQLRTLAEQGKFPVYLYWDVVKKKFCFDVVKRSDAVGSIWKNPFSEAKVETFVPTDLAEQEICRKVNDIFEQKLQVYPEQVVPSAAPYFDLGADSLDMVEVIMTLEKTFGIKISDTEAEKLRTVEDFQRICIRLLAEKKSTK
mgnify:CR=1 FL=1